MKKLALALMCLVSIAFFASCNPEGQPTIHTYIEEGYVTDGDVVHIDDVVYFGFVMASSPVSNSLLTNLEVKIDGVAWETVDLTGKTEYTYTSFFAFDAKEIIGEVVISAIVTDATGQIATASITVSVDGEPQSDDDPLIASTFDWSRKGLDLESADAMHAVGLDWPGNYRDEVYVKIVPMTGCSMYVLDGDDFDAIETQGDKDEYFAWLMENATPDTEYKEISAYHDGTYNTMLAVIDANGECHLVHFEKATAELLTAGALIHLYGALK